MDRSQPGDPPTPMLDAEWYPRDVMVTNPTPMCGAEWHLRDLMVSPTRAVLRGVAIGRTAGADAGELESVIAVDVHRW